MKIIFTNYFSNRINAPFALYEFDEYLAKKPLYIDIRGIVRKRRLLWLDDLHKSFSKVSSAFLRYTRWWWVTPMSRFDARPWGQEPLIKPLFFAKAILEWRKENPDFKTMYLIGCNPLVAVYLKEFDKSVIFKGDRKIFRLFFLTKHIIKQSVIAIAKMTLTAYYVFRYHLFAKGKMIIDRSIIILYEFAMVDKPKMRPNYYFTNIFNHIQRDIADKIYFVCISFLRPATNTFRKKMHEDKEFLFLLDNINLIDLIRGVLINVNIIFKTHILNFFKLSCNIGEGSSNIFFKFYMFNEVGRLSCLSSILCYSSLKRLFYQNNYKLAVYPYEEKGVERAILFACNEYSVRTIGYTPHPQHNLALALRDVYKPVSPKPSSYAFCGPAYIEYFTLWGKKKPDKMKVWGSGKSIKGSLIKQEFNRHELKIIVLLSHPNELRVFGSWLRADNRLRENTYYLIRIYKPAYKAFENDLKKLIREFNFVEESQGSLIEDMKKCNLAIFSGTSAGIEAINNGYLALYTDLNDFFEINPCFDDLNVMLPSYSSKEFADRLDEICLMGNNSLIELHKKQLSLSKNIFSSIDINAVERDMQC